MILKSYKDQKCLIEGCDKIVEYNIFSKCSVHAHNEIVSLQWELFREAFPEMNGLTKKEPTNPYAKFLRRIAGDDES